MSRLKSGTPTRSSIPAAIQSGVVPRPRRLSVLLVDPDRTARTRLAHALSERYAVFEAEDGLVALRLASMIPNLAVVVSELKLPTFNGLDLAKVFRAHLELKHIPFVFVSDISPTDAMRCISAGAARCFDKTRSSRTIANAVIKIVRASTATRAA